MKNRKSVVALLLVAIIGIVGLTVAYFSNSTSITNEFETSEYGTDVTETFTSPTGWQPGDETPKVLTVKNTGEVDEAVRVKVEEKWVNKNGQELSLTQDGNVAALIHYINDSDWTRVDVANEDYYYYYYNYKLAPEEETSELLDKVIFNPLINASTTCTTTTENGVTTRSCQSNGSGYDGATYTLKFNIETVQYNKYQESWNTDVAIAEEKPHSATQFLAENATNPADAEYNATTKGKMFQFTHTLNEGTENEKTITETRYIGDDPKNYIYFNCDDPVDGETYDYATSCEVWRILGVFDVERTDPNDATKTIIEQRMKLVRGTDLLTTRMWDNRTSEQFPSSNFGKNDWNESSIQTFLTGDYYNRTGEAESNGLKLSARNMIDNAIFYLGGFPYSNSDTTYNVEKIYEMERGTETCVTTGVCSGGTRTTSWEGKVALMYPSDMYITYAKTDGVGCYNQPMSSIVCGSTNVAKSWIYNTNKLERNSSYQLTWFLSHVSSDSIDVFHAISGNLSNTFGSMAEGVRPVVYLSATVQIFDGDGSSENPYKLK